MQYQNMGPFSPVNFKGTAKVTAVPVFTKQMPLTIGGLAGEDAYFGRIVSVDPIAPREFANGWSSGRVVKGIYVMDPTIMTADPGMNDKYYEGRPATLVTFGLVELSQWELSSDSPTEGSNVWFNNTTGEIAFTASTVNTLAGHTKLNAFVYEVLDPNGVKIFFNGPLVAATSTALTAVATPTVTPAAGAVTFPITAVVACTTPGATLYYTLDGTTPTMNSDTVPATGIVLTAAVTLNVIGIKEGMNPSAALTAVYTAA